MSRPHGLRGEYASASEFTNDVQLLAQRQNKTVREVRQSHCTSLRIAFAPLRVVSWCVSDGVCVIRDLLNQIC